MFVLCGVVGLKYDRLSYEDTCVRILLVCLCTTVFINALHGFVFHGQSGML